MKKNVFLFFAVFFGFISCQTDAILPSDILESRSVKQYIHALVFTPAKPTSLINNKYAVVFDLQLRLRKGDLIHIGLRTTTEHELTDLAYQFKKSNGQWSEFKPFTYKFTNTLAGNHWSNYVCQLPLLDTAIYRLALIKPADRPTYLMPELYVELERVDQTNITAYNGVRDHDKMPCPDLEKDIEQHQLLLDELRAIKAACDQIPAPAPSVPVLGADTPTESPMGSDPGGGDSACEGIDSRIETVQNDLDDAVKEYNKRCKPQVTLQSIDPLSKN